MDYKFGSKENNKKELIRNELKYWEENPAQSRKLNDYTYYKYHSNFDDSAYKGLLPKPTIDSLFSLLNRNKEAYYHFASKDMFGNIHQILRHFLLYEKEEPYELAYLGARRSPSGLGRELERLSEKEREDWISKIGKVDCTLDGLCGDIYKSTNEEKNWILENDIANLKISDQEKLEILGNKFKRIHFDFSDRRKISDQYYMKNSTEVLEELFILNRKVYRTMPQTAYEIFSIYEPKSNFNLIDNLIIKYWTNYPDIHNSDQKTRYRAIAKFANDIKSGKIHEPEVELLGFSKSQKQELNQVQTNKFEQPKLKM
ncbi:hypothetical protein Q4502_01950 [Mesomycoplasma ovipneumoniae]|uniref:hypothetical protein n=1 Tax=Mesomycoplasma ovipneumoniae TaxID=29562 RepID=UPI0026E151FA|nr:hypothetical protein [Mesomycoplasma ovipneumoniae]MDO6856465.1 hypothetical protein [Mesomycoplasma ovipneumoniae]